jgi:RimJ/RimL family protein N-acetyltransferase
VTGDRALMRLHVAALFTHDARGRLLRVNEPGGGPAPRFFLGRTAEGSEWRVRHDVDDALARELAAMCYDELPGAELRVPPDAAARYEAARYEATLARVAPVEKREAGPAYAFPSELPAAAGTVIVTAERSGLLRAHLAPWQEDVERGALVVAALAGDAAVAVCATVRATPAAVEAGVETAPDFRRRGHGRRAVAAWARLVREAGLVPLYSTSWENAASRALARSLGLRQFGADLHLA